MIIVNFFSSVIQGSWWDFSIISILMIFKNWKKISFNNISEMVYFQSNIYSWSYGISDNKTSYSHWKFFGFKRVSPIIQDEHVICIRTIHQLLKCPKPVCYSWNHKIRDLKYYSIMNFQTYPIIFCEHIWSSSCSLYTGTQYKTPIENKR